MHLTVIIGSNGPKISSSMIADSSGGSTKIVGSMNLQRVNVLLEDKLVSAVME